MRIAHFSDIHVQREPSLGDLLGKRFLGLANLRLMGRGGEFSDRTVRALIDAILDQKPDLALCTGDLTAMALPKEFEAARDLLSPLVDHLPFVLVPGNHDVYTAKADRERPLERHFGAFTGGGRYPSLHRFGEVSVIGLDPCRFHPIFASGRLEGPQLGALEQLLAAPDLDATFNLLALHYPLRNRDGFPYGPAIRSLRGARALEAVLDRVGRVQLVVHGHVHRGFRTTLPSGVPIFDPGSGGIHGPARLRTAHFNVYDIAGGELRGVERFAFDGERFNPEVGGPYASGR